MRRRAERVMPSGDREEASSEGLGGHHRLAQTDAARSSGPATVLAVKKDGQFLRDTNHAMESYP